MTVIYGDTPTLTEEIGLGFINQGTTTNQMLYLYPFNAMPTDGSFTVEFLLQHSANTPGQIDPYLSFAASTTNSNALFIFIENNDLLRFILNGTIYNTTVARDDLADGDVHRLSMTFNEATDQVRIFIDGALADEVTIANGRAIMSNFGALVFGQDQDTLASGFDPSQVFEGGLGDIRIWNGIRTDQEIADTWNYLLDDPANEDLAANWVVNPVTGAISDISGNGLILRPLTTTKTNITLTTLGSFESGPFANPDGGNDVISGGDGDDTLYGVSGNDQLLGNAGADTLNGGDGNDVLTGGADDDMLNGDAGDDILVGGDGADTMNGGDGFDSVYYTDEATGVVVDLSGATSNGGAALGDVLTSVEAVHGSAFDDTLTGSDGDDELIGGDGDDILIGGDGSDFFEGGAGADTIDGGADGTIFDQISYLDSATGVTVNLTTGLGQGGDAEGDVITNIESVVGSLFDDVIYGDANDNTMFGFHGNDLFYADAGADYYNGGVNGQFGDTVSYANSSAAITINLSTNEASGGYADGDFLTSVENITGSSFDDQITGTITVNRLNGGDGNDQIIGSWGGDILTGGAGADTFVYYSTDDADSGLGETITDWEVGVDSIEFAGVQLLFASLTEIAPNHYRFYAESGAGAMEIAIFTDGPMTLSDIGDLGGLIMGTEGDDNIAGTNLNERILGLAGDDIIEGGGGFDFVDGGDHVNGDTLSFRNATSSANVALGDGSNDGYFSVNFIDSIARNFEHIIGSSFNDSLFGNASDNRISGGDGDDTLGGGLGNDVLDGGDGFDLVYYWGLTSGVNVRLNGSSTPQNTGAGGIDTLIGFEGIIGTDYADSLRGNSVANFLLGEDGDDVLIGFAGDDTLEGGEGNDFLNGGTGADMMRGSLGNDIYYVDNVGDVVVERASETAENEEGIDEVRTTLNGYVLGDNVENLRLQGAATSGTGNDLANIIIAGIGPATLTGLGGNDTIYGSASGDSIDGGTDNDALYGRNGNDNINGGDGDDLIRGQFGSDTLHGDAGNDLLFGDEGQDTIYGGDGDDDLRGGIQTDTLNGESGNDFLRGEDGNDILYGGAGRDVFTGGAGNDQFWFMDGDFAGLTSSTADRITDFVSGSDRIRLDLVDANIHVAGDQAFQFIGTTAFTGAGTSSSGELRYEVVGGSTIISGDTDGDGTADFAIALTGNYALIVGDFGL